MSMSAHGPRLRRAPFEIPVDEEITLQWVLGSDADTTYDLVSTSRAFLMFAFDASPKVFTPERAFSTCMEYETENLAGTSAYYKILRDTGPPENVRQYVGAAGLLDRQRHEGEDVAELGYWVVEAASRQGITSRATRSLVDYGLHKWGLDRIILHTHPDNIGSRRVAEGLGAELVTEIRVEGPYGPQATDLWEITRHEQ